MEREVSFLDISDGRKYGLNDMVRADCNDCKGCHACCQHMGNSIVLDPLDVFNLMKGLACSFEQLLQSAVELSVQDGIILPNLKMAGNDERCTFLNSEGRCSVHAFRPGICRIFPLGRIYENQSFSYFLQVHECKNDNKSKIKVKKWIDCENLEKNQKFINDWHYYIKDLQKQVKECGDENQVRSISMNLLNRFYLMPYSIDEDFYVQFYNRFAGR